MRPLARPWSRRVLILIAVLIVLAYPSKPVTVAQRKQAATSKIAHAPSGRPLRRNDRALAFILAIAAQLQSGHHQ
jgi:hypothetical protein